MSEEKKETKETEEEFMPGKEKTKGDGIEEEFIPEKEISQRTVNALLEEGTSFKVTIRKKKWYHKLKLRPVERNFVLYPIKLAPLHKVSELLMSIATVEVLEGEDVLKTGIQSVVENQEIILKAVAYAIHNDKGKPSIGLVPFLRNNLTAQELLQLLIIIVRQMDVVDFLSGIALIQKINILKTVPKPS